MAGTFRPVKNEVHLIAREGGGGKGGRGLKKREWEKKKEAPLFTINTTSTASRGGGEGEEGRCLKRLPVEEGKKKKRGEE